MPSRPMWPRTTGQARPDRIQKGIRSAGLYKRGVLHRHQRAGLRLCRRRSWGFSSTRHRPRSSRRACSTSASRAHAIIGIGVLFLLYGYYRAVNQPGMSVVLTIASLGTRVALAYLLSATPLGVTGIWLSVPIGWALADAIGIGYYLKKHRAKYAVQA